MYSRSRRYLRAPLWAFYAGAVLLNLILGTRSGLGLAGAVVSFVLLITAHKVLRGWAKSAMPRDWALAALAMLLAVPMYALAAYIFTASFIP